MYVWLGGLGVVVHCRGSLQATAVPQPQFGFEISTLSEAIYPHLDDCGTTLLHDGDELAVQPLRAVCQHLPDGLAVDGTVVDIRVLWRQEQEQRQHEANAMQSSSLAAE